MATSTAVTPLTVTRAPISFATTRTMIVIRLHLNHRYRIFRTGLRPSCIDRLSFHADNRNFR